MRKEEVLDNLSYENKEQREKIKEYLTSPDDLDSSKKTIVFSTPSETGTSFFRIFEPMKAILRNFSEEVNLVYTENINPSHLKIGDCVVMHRCGNHHSHYLSAAQYWPKTEIRPYIIHDADDNEFNLPATHPMKEIWEQAGKDKMSIHSIKNSDCVTTTTNKLRQTFNNFNRNVKVFKNMFDWNLPQWNLDKNTVRKEMLSDWDLDGKIVIGWAGLTSHFSDLTKMAPFIKDVHDRYPNTVFVIAGLALKDSSIEITQDEQGNKSYKEVEVENEEEKYATRVKNLFEGIDPNRIKFFEALQLEEYGRFNCLFDISLAYVEHNAFNSCKSEIKVVEALRYGAIPVFSNFGGYKDMWDSVPSNIKENNLAISMTSSSIWSKALSHWIENFEQGQKISSALKEWSDNYYDINNNIENYLSFLLEETEEHREGQINSINKYTVYNP